MSSSFDEVRVSRSMAAKNKGCLERLFRDGQTVDEHVQACHKKAFTMKIKFGIVERAF